MDFLDPLIHEKLLVDYDEGFYTPFLTLTLTLTLPLTLTLTLTLTTRMSLAGARPHRWRLGYSPLAPRAAECAAGRALLYAGKATLITGGLGRIGLALAASLLECGDGAVVLTTRGT